ncbi:MAG TPA: hypothetical protein VKD43_07270 [Xanthobacteraceae bacterium]|nr:hypothetical protein [Xanthobacteraceae bacterium]
MDKVFNTRSPRLGRALRIATALLFLAELYCFVLLYVAVVGGGAWTPPKKKAAETAAFRLVDVTRRA